MLKITGQGNANHNTIYHLTPVRMAKSKKDKEVRSAWDDAEKGNSVTLLGNNGNWFNYYRKSYGGFSKNYHTTQQFYFWVFIRRKWKH